MARDLLSTPPPLAPPRTQGAQVSWLRLIRSHRVGPTTFFRLMSEHGSAEAALAALPDVAAKAGVKKYSIAGKDAAEAELDAGKAAGATPLFFPDPAYPAALREIPDPPPVLWTLGRQELASQPMVALVGARNASSLGTRMTRSLAEGLGAAGFVVISGLARGIDRAAHLASLASGTIAVQAGGIDVIYPLENTALHAEIAQDGLRLSEQPPGLAPQARHFPRRNRIISGCACAIIVVEAASKSGSLLTARNAADQGRDIMAVPGHPMDRRASGCNMLIRDGATLIRSVDDVLEALQPALNGAQAGQADGAHTSAIEPPEPAAVSGEDILRRLGPTPLAEDQLIRDMARPSRVVLSAITALEMEGRIARQPGGLLSLAS